MALIVEKNRMNPLQAGSVVEAITSKGMEKVLITYLDKTRYEGHQLTRQPGVLGSLLTGEPGDLFSEIPGEHGVIISTADDTAYGIYVYRQDDTLSLYHRDTGELIDKVQSPERALKIASHKLLEYADDGEEFVGTDWSKTRAQGKALNNETNLAFLKLQLGY